MRKRAKSRKTYHTFKRKRRNPVPGEDDILEIKALVRKAPGIVVLPITEKSILEAIDRDGQADGQNCGGAVCTRKNGHLFKHPVSGMVDWWRNRVYILHKKPNKQGVPICTEYAHYDQIEQLFDTDAGLQRLLGRIRKEPNRMLFVTLYPIQRHGYNPKTGRRVVPGNPSGGAGTHRKIGAELRFENWASARAG